MDNGTYDRVGAGIRCPFFECVDVDVSWNILLDELLTNGLCMHPLAEPCSCDCMECDVFGCSVSRGLNYWDGQREGLTKSMAEIIGIDDGRRKRIRRVDVLPSHVLVMIKKQNIFQADSWQPSLLTTEPRANGCCNQHQLESEEPREKQFE